MASSSRRLIHLILDFDGTLTTTDTIALLANAAYALHPQSPPPPPPPPAWQQMASAYQADCTAHARQHTKPELRTTVAAEAAFLASLLPVERASIERIESAGIFAGLRPDDIARAAATTAPVRAGFWQDLCCGQVLGAGGAVDILSVNWSRVWIQSSLLAAISTPSPSPSSPPLSSQGSECKRFSSQIGIYCNDLVVCASTGLTTGQMTREPVLGGNVGIWTAEHKEKMMEHLVKKRRVAAEEEALTVYVGDSSTDLLCLLKADVGLVVGDGLDGTCARIGVKLTPAGPDHAIGRRGGGPPQQLLKVRGLEEIGRLLVKQEIKAP